MANIAVVVPCYNVKAQIGSVLEAMPPCVARIFVVDDCCPEKTGSLSARNSRTPGFESLLMRRIRESAGR